MTDQAPVTAAPADGDADANPEKESWGSFLWFCAKLVLAVLLFRTLLFSFFTIPSESMLPGLRNGDYLIAAKWPYGYNENSLPLGLPGPEERIFASPPERGDVVVFKHPVDRTDYVKRIIGLPGDSVAMRSGRLVLNGKPVERQDAPPILLPLSLNTSCHPRALQVEGPEGPACRYNQALEVLPNGKRYPIIDLGPTPQDDFGPVIVPAGQLFLVGDNRDNSQDSRYPARAGGGVGLVDQRLLVARASMVLWSTDGSAEWLLPWTWFTAARWNRIGSDI
ncbi:signal peptidase I [Qipengyuania sp. XHP0207]|uniref:signal peptidase I n=1 Tax=Qipengyuania sp. XHP0207 TaxID=3038078 RepID=UPI00241F23D4|nr:signal peptidase I [Qipengyuania sp. XHP0207]MDG5747137.1 signal peptidase I [Qipengyuania sp. XHP0207]